MVWVTHWAVATRVVMATDVGVGELWVMPLFDLSLVLCTPLLYPLIKKTSEVSPKTTPIWVFPYV